MTLRSVDGRRWPQSGAKEALIIKDAGTVGPRGKSPWLSSRTNSLGIETMQSRSNVTPRMAIRILAVQSVSRKNDQSVSMGRT